MGRPQAAERLGESVSNLVYRHERPLRTLATVMGALIWLLLVVGTFGVALVYVAIGLLLYLFAQSAFIAHLRGNAVVLSPAQFPDLHAQYLDACQRLGVRDAPTAYLMMSDGVINALATRFLRRRYIVMFSSAVEALRKHPDALRFYFGHELGHIVQGHLDWRLLRAPAMLLPLLGAALRRAEEYTCDLHGQAACQRPADAALALAVLAAGGERWPQLNLGQFAAQSAQSGGFWMSFHELTGDYPWLSKRMGRLMQAAGGAAPPVPARHPLAWVLAAFIPRAGVGGAGGLLSLMVVIAMLGILLAIAIPAYDDYRARAEASAVVPELERVRAALAPYVAQNKAYPESLADVGLGDARYAAPIAAVELENDGIVFRLESSSRPLSGKTLKLEAFTGEDGRIGWRCVGGTLEARHRPQACREGAVLGYDADRG